MSKDLLIGILFYICLQVAIWFSTSAQFVDAWKDKAFYIMVGLSLSTALFAYYGAKYTYSAVGDSVWGARFVGSGAAYLVFPWLTWIFLHESAFTVKTGLCIVLSLLILVVQVWVK